AAWPLLKESDGALVAIAGTSGRKPGKQFTIGSSGNAAVAAFSKCLAGLGKGDGVRVNCHYPSLLETERELGRGAGAGRAGGEAGAGGKNTGQVLPRNRHHTIRHRRGRGRLRYLHRLRARDVAARRDRGPGRRSNTHNLNSVGRSMTCMMYWRNVGAG